MKKMGQTVALIMVFICCGAVSCRNGGIPALSALSSEYSLDEAKDDGCVVYEDGNITSGQNRWDEFVVKVKECEAASVRIAFYYTLSDESCISLDLYEEIKGRYPVLYVREITFNGTQHQVSWYENGRKKSRTFDYLHRYEGIQNVPDSKIIKYTYYVLANDPMATWLQIEQGIYSSNSKDWIDHMMVYSKLIEQSI